MNDLKKKFEFQNSTITVQCLCKLSQDLLKKCTTRVQEGNQEIPELKQLLDCLGSADSLESQLSGQVILHLVETDVLDLTLALNSTLNSVPSCKNLIGAVETVFGLLLLESKAVLASETVYRCPYTLRGPTHPLISVLINRPDSWPFLVENTASLLSHKEKRLYLAAVLEILRPFLFYVFLEPLQSTQYNNTRTGLWRVLLAAARCDQHVLEFIVSLLPHVPSTGRDQLLVVSQMSTDLIEELVSKIKEQKKQGHSTLWATTNEMLLFGLDLILKGITAGAPLFELSQKMCMLAQFQTTAPTVCLFQTVKANTALLQLSEILARATFFQQAQLIDFADHLITLCQQSCQFICLASVVKPLIQIVASPSLTLSQSQGVSQGTVRAKATQLLSRVETLLEAHQPVNQEPEQPHKWTQFGSTFHFFSELCGQLGGQSLQEGHTLTTWLVNLATTLEACCPVLNHVIAAVLITSSSDEVSSAALEVVKRIAIVDPKQSTDYLPLLLYVLNRTNSPGRKLHILETLPCLATHKLCIPPILKTILALSKSADLKPISIRLMMLLWKQQERCFPQLLQLISDSQGSSSYQVRLAVASVILEICTHKPEQHGAELLTALTDILKTSSTEQDIPVSVLALRGLSKLCESEVMDLMSLWSYLGETFLNETRPLVVKELCGLLSLVPQLAVETQEYETFTKLAVMRLWAYSQSSNCLVCAAAYEALSKYSVKYFCVSYLPKSVTKDLYEQLDLAVKQMQEGKGKSDTKTDGDALDVDIMFPQIPGSCFVSILQSLTDSVVISAYKKLLQSLMATEITDLPRSVYFSSAGKKSMASQGGKILEKIPSFLLKQYNNCKQPGLRQGLAAGLLFCYDPPLEVSRDGRARKHYIIRHGKTFLETFVTLLQEVPIQTSDWHRFSLLPQAWNSFMERLFLSLLESRKADLELQEKHGHISSSDLAEKNIVVWLSTRDAILDAIKTTSRGSPTAQANCVLSLASLALCLHKYVTDLSADLFKASQDRTEYIGHSHWMAMSFDTILSFVDPEHVPKGNIHSICHQKSSPHDAGQPSNLCCAVARLATSQLVPLLVASDSDQIVHILKTFTSCLPTGQSALTSPVSIFCNGLALGMVLEILFQEHFSDMTGSKGMLAVWKALTSLEDITYNSEVENRIGCVLGLTLAICAMCSDGKTESRVHATAVLEKLTPVWLDTPCDKDYYQVLTFSVACITTSVYSTNTLDISCVLPSIEKLNQVHQQYPQYSGVCLSLGLILFSLHRLGVEVATSLRQELLTAWLKDVSDDNRLPLEKVSKLNGLVSLIGSEQLLFPVISNSALLTDDLITGVVSRLMAIVGDYDDLGLQNISSWFLGHLYLSSTSSGGDKCTSVPGSLSYLPEWSLLRAFYDFLLDSGRSIPDNHLISLVNVALQVINVKTTLPPVNWAIMLSPYMRNNSYGDEVRANILQVAISQIQSPSAVVFISSWLTPPLYASLQLSCKTVLHLHMCQLIRSMSPNVLQVYLERSCLTEFSESETQNICIQLAILKGLRDALAVTDPPEAVTSLLHSATAQIYHQLTTDFNIQLLQSMAECLSQLPAEIMDNVIATDFSDASSQVKGCFVRCHLVATGKQPLGLLNFMIDAFFNADYWNQEVGMVLLFNCFGAYSKYKGENSSLSARQQWFLELLGHTRTVVIGAMPLAATAPTKDKVIRYIANIVTAGMLTLTYPACTDLDFWGFSQKLFAPPVDKITQQESQILDVCFQNEPPLPNLGILYSTMIQFLPSIIGAMGTKKWEGFLTKVIDWVLILCETDETDLETRICLHATLMSLRNSQAFRSVSVWTKVIQLTC